MDTDTLIGMGLALCLAGAALQAWRLGNERRDVVLLAVIGGLLATGTAVAAIVPG